MATVRRPRVVVGVDGSLTSLRALRQAVNEARRRQAELTVIHVRPPAGPSAHAALIGFPDLTPCPVQQTRHALDREAEALIATCIDDALGGPPRDVTVRFVVDVGVPQVCLVQYAQRDDDLLVVGTRSSGRWAGHWSRSVSRYCTTHAACPVLVVPPGSFARATRRDRRRCWPLQHRDLWKQFDRQVGDGRQHVGGT